MIISVIGAGSWGTALAFLLAKKGHDIRMWARETEIVYNINRHNKNGIYLPDLPLPANIRAFSDPGESILQADALIFATPSHAMRDMAALLKSHLRGNEWIVSVSKGIENETFLTMSQVLTQMLDGVIDENQIGVLSGPSHAEEVANLMPTTVVASSYAKKTSQFIQELFITPHFRVYTNRDIIGVEVSGAVKNIMAIAAGIADGAELGDNAKAALITRGLTEMRRLGISLGASQDTFSGLTGIGDLIVTCTSRHSRNRELGYRIGKGESLESITQSMKMIAEGVKTTRSVYHWSRSLSVNMPITEKVYQVLFEGTPPMEAVHELMTREPKEEVIF